MSISIMAVFLPFIIDRLAPDALTKRSENGDVWLFSLLAGPLANLMAQRDLVPRLA
jgi:hypothetical protein